jgi:hypothetical protein
MEEEHVKVMCIVDFESDDVRSFEKKKIYSGFKSADVFIIQDTDHHGWVFYQKGPKNHLRIKRYFEDYFEILEDWRNFRIETVLS